MVQFMQSHALTPLLG